MTKDNEKQQLEKQFTNTHNNNEPSFSSSGTPLPPLPEAPSAPPDYLFEVQLPRVCCITLNETDKIRLLGVPHVLVIPIRNAIISSWGQIQSEQVYYGAHEFKLLGMPWRGQGNESITARMLLVSVLRAMAVNGWNMIQAADVIQQEGRILGAHEFKLRGNPWRPHGAETVFSRMFLSQLLANIRAQGFKLYTSVDMSHGQEEKRETETWIFRRVGRTWS
ncbi:hypothetical protein BGZ95_003992 [Linnemannia exigua]|uniref:Uncharacterized protein n=1 Tax=Linnemannia exigua TaxID=604196 RepID=A0AAD4D588_9FUNG|nr:hypothetical protein BGZ95_003992 [Linnemannia exigua]